LKGFESITVYKDTVSLKMFLTIRMNPLSKGALRHYFTGSNRNGTKLLNDSKIITTKLNAIKNE
jgi:hypothetical protein